MTYDPKRRDATWQMIQPGCWLDPKGAAHLFPDEIIAFLQYEHPEAGFNYSHEDYDLIVETFKEQMRSVLGADIRFETVKHFRQQG